MNAYVQNRLVRKAQKGWISLVYIMLSLTAHANFTYEKIGTWINQDVKIILEVGINRDNTEFSLIPILTIVENKHTTVYSNISTQFAKNAIKEWELWRKNHDQKILSKDILFGDHTFHCVNNNSLIQMNPDSKIQLHWNEVVDISLAIISISQLSEQKIPIDSKIVIKKIIENKDFLRVGYK